VSTFEKWYKKSTFQSQISASENIKSNFILSTQFYIKNIALGFYYSKSTHTLDRLTNLAAKTEVFFFQLSTFSYN